MYCQSCGTRTATKYVSFHQNIGALILRFSRTIQGELCKRCIHNYFWEYTAITLCAGWWGIISFIVTPFFIINNVAYYLSCLGMGSADSPSRGEEAAAIPR